MKSPIVSKMPAVNVSQSQICIKIIELHSTPFHFPHLYLSIAKLSVRADDSHLYLELFEASLLFPMFHAVDPYLTQSTQGHCKAYVQQIYLLHEDILDLYQFFIRDRVD